MDLHEIKIKDINHLVPNLLMNKLVKIGIDNLDELMSIELEKFLEHDGVGKKAGRLLIEIQTWIKENEKELYDVKKAKFQNILDETEVPTLIDVEFSKIKSLIPTKLLSKFERHNIRTVGELCLISKDEFSKLESVGVGTIKLLEEFVDKIKNNSLKVTQEYLKNTQGITIPSNEKVSNSLVSNLKVILDEYTDWLEQNDKRLADILVRYFGLRNNVSCFMDDLGLFYEITRERVRQLLDLILADIKSFFEGNKSEYASVVCEEKLQKGVIDFISLLKNERVLNSLEFEGLLQDKYHYKLGKDTLPYLEVLFRAFDFKISGKVESSFTEYSFYFFDDSIDKSSFFDTGKVIIDYLKGVVLPVDLFSIIVNSKKRKKGIEKEFVELILSKMPEIKQVEKNGKMLYYLRLDMLNSSGDMAERVLYEIGEPTHVDDLVSSINRNLFLLGSTKSVTKVAVLNQLKAKEHLSFKGKTGIYGFKEWGGNNEPLVNLIKQAFLNSNQPLNNNQIVNYVKGVRPNANSRSIRTIVNMECLSLGKNRYILKEWKRKYSDEIVEKTSRDRSKKTRLETTIEVLKNTDDELMALKDLAHKLKNEFKFPSPTVYATLNNSEYFEKVYIDNKAYVKLNRDKVSSISKEIGSEKFQAFTYQYFSSRSDRVELRKFVAIASDKLKRNRQTIYKYISEKPELYQKDQIGTITYLSLKNAGSNKNHSSFLNLFDWSIVKKLLKEELLDIFQDHRQKNYERALDDALSLFQELILKETGDNDLDGLEEQMIPSIYKFYWSKNDRHDLINHLKQISTSLDPFLQKILYMINEEKYKRLKKSKTGLGGYIKALDKLDPSENRYREKLKSVPVHHFGKHMNRAYNSRNVIAHNAKKFSRTQITETISSTITICIMAVFEYYDELYVKLK